MNKQVLAHFKTNDQNVHKLLVAAAKHKYPLRMEKAKPDQYFLKLCRSIVHQQLAGKAANKIFDRFLSLFPNKNPTPKKLLKLTQEKLRAVGLSNSKANYLRNIAQAISDETLLLEKLPAMTDAEVIIMLTKIKGIGNWTAEMFLMFTLGREDVFSVGDYGLKKGIKKVYNFKKDPTPKQIEKIVKKWSPYKTYASMMMWAALDQEFALN